VVLGSQRLVVSRADARAIVRNLDELRAVLLQPYLHHRRARVQRIFNQLLYRTRQVEHNLSRTYAVDGRRFDGPDRSHSAARLSGFQVCSL